MSEPQPSDPWEDWRRATRANPCPICSGKKWCSVGTRFVHCMRTASERPASNSEGWLHAIPGAGATMAHAPAPTKPKAPRRSSDEWAAIARRLAAEITAEQVQQLADQLGVTTTSLRDLGIGYGLVPGGEDRRGTFAWNRYTFPMYDSDGTICGLRTRDLTTGKKLAMTGSKLGVVRRVKPDDGLLVICEGESDTATALTLGFDAIGRPGVTTCVDIAVAYARGRDTVVIADNDDPNDPNKQAAIKGVQRLIAALVPAARSVRLIRPPAGLKDLREWRRAGATEIDVRRAIDAAVIVTNEVVEREAARVAEAQRTGRRPPDWLGTRDPTTGRIILSADETLPTAEAFVREHHSHHEGPTLHCHADMLLTWVSNRYVEAEGNAVRKTLHEWLHHALTPRWNPKTEQFELHQFKANPRTVASALDSIRNYTHLPASVITPCWLGDDSDRPPPHELVACRSATLHVPSGVLYPPSPRLFCTAALDFDYDPSAPEPRRWLEFLDGLIGDDTESLEMLQDWCGYVLTADTRLQKAMLIVGPRRSGKGTIARVLTRLVGASNVVGPTVGSLAGPFGLQPLLGKSLAVVSDARFAGEGVMVVVERLLCITGEDAVSVERKYLPAVTLKLPTRFMFLTNELPRWNDSAAALAGRFLLLRLTRSYYGQEDHQLTDSLLAELPSILNWALVGWRRLHERGRFIEPASSSDVVQELADLSSPVTVFLRERCELGAEYRVATKLLYRAWQEWCEAEGRSRPTTQATFGRDLFTVEPRVKRRQGTLGERFYDGIRLK